MSWPDDLSDGGYDYDVGYVDDDDEDDYGVGQVAIYCDNRCGTEFRGDFVGADYEARL